MTTRKPIDDALHQPPAASAPTPYVWFDHRPWFLALVLVLVTFAAYQPVWRAGFIWDDAGHVTDNMNLHSLGGLRRIWFKPEASQQYYPLQLTSYWVEFHVWRLRPLGYHLVNVLLHAFNAVLLWQVLRRLEVPGAWLAAAIFAVHPVEVESVAWISERKNVLSVMFYLLALLAFFRYRPLTAVIKEDRVFDWRFYLLGLFLFLSALLSKTVACSLPAVMVLLIWWKKGRVEKRDVYVLTPLFVIGIALGLMTAWLEKYHVHAGMDWSLSFVQRCLLAGRALWFYTGKLFWPYQLSFMYPRWEIDASVWWQYLFPLSAAAVLIALWLLRRRVGKAPLVAVLVFAVNLFPALGFFDVFPFCYSFVADHFQYLASVGLITLAASATAKICERTGRLGKRIVTAVSAIALVVLGVLTWQQGWSFRDGETLWRHTLANSPNSWGAHWFLGHMLQDSGRSSEAIGHYEQVLRINPGYADASDTLGVVLMGQGRLREAIGYFEQALRIKPDDAYAHYNLGLALGRTGRLQEAIEHCEQALRIKPDLTEAHNNLGDALMGQGRLQEAIGHYEQVLRSKPDSGETHNNLGFALMGQGRLQEAIGHYEQALRIKPDYAKAHYSLGVALERAGRLQDAIGHYEQALRIKPDFTQAQTALARLQARQ